MRKVLVYGKTGQVAQCLRDNAKINGFEILHFGRPETAIMDGGVIANVVKIPTP